MRRKEIIILAVILSLLITSCCTPVRQTVIEETPADACEGFRYTFRQSDNIICGDTYSCPDCDGRYVHIYIAPFGTHKASLSFKDGPITVIDNYTNIAVRYWKWGEE